MKDIKHQPEYNEAIAQAEADFRTPDGKEMKDKCPYLFSSNMADAYWIAAHCLYHVGRIPRALHKSRGHSWLADVPNYGTVRVTVENPDQRDGVLIGERAA